MRKIPIKISISHKALNTLRNPYLVLDVLELHDGDSDEPIVAAEAIVLDGDVQLVRADAVFVADHKVERLVVLWRPVGVLAVRHLSPFFVAQMRTDQVDLDEWLERLSSRPSEVIRGHNCSKYNNRCKATGRFNIIIPLTVTLCSPVPGCVYKSTCTETSPTLPSSEDVSENQSSH